MHVFYVNIIVYTYMLPIISYFYTGTSTCYLIFSQWLVPAINTHITYVHSIRVLMITIFEISNYLRTEKF